MSTNIIQQMKAIEAERERMFAIFCADTGAGDMHRPFDNYRAGYKAATSRQEAKIKALAEALTAITELDASDTEEGFNEWGEAFCFGEAKRIAGEALAAKETP